MTTSTEGAVPENFECPYCESKDFEQGCLFSKSETGFMSDEDDS